jgi:hypothetical protein
MIAVGDSYLVGKSDASLLIKLRLVVGCYYGMGSSLLRLVGSSLRIGII